MKGNNIQFHVPVPRSSGESSPAIRDTQIESMATVYALIHCYFSISVVALIEQSYPLMMVAIEHASCSVGLEAVRQWFANTSLEVDGN